MSAKNPTIVISGSFRRAYDGIHKAVKVFEALGLIVLSPKASTIINPGEEVAILATDTTQDPRTLEQGHLAAIKAADVLYLYNPDGYLGPSSVMELGWALALGKKVFCKESSSDMVLKLFSGIVASPEEVVRRLKTETGVESS